MVRKLIDNSSLGKDDVVHEIGAGQGIITEELLKKCGKVIAFELDRNLSTKLAVRFRNQTSFELKSTDFLNYPIPDYPYKVFSNIPFNITSALIKKLTQSDNPPNDTYLIVQEEAAKKFVGKPYDNKNSQISILLKPSFKMEVIYKFQRNDFHPKPNINTVLLRIKRLETPLIDPKDKALYEDFVVFTFNQFKPNIKEGLSTIFNTQTLNNLSREIGKSLNLKPSRLEFEMWLKLFTFFLKNLDQRSKRIVLGSANRLLKQQAKLIKIHRTRTDKDWKDYIS